ncbi:MAG: hypothetical protein QME62_00630, partial [Armatimonadota bacterium]|nr:hypothetical protein [Armatimonadota bacterium]
MKTSVLVRAMLVLGLVLLLGYAIAAQTNQQFHVTVKPSPPLRPGLPASADIFVDGRFAMRIPAPAGGMSPMQRANIVAERLRNALSAGEKWDNARVAQVDGNWVVALGDHVIATADTRSARAFNRSPAGLASLWARTTVVALGGRPSTIAMQLQPPRVEVAGAREEIVMWQNSPTKTLPLLDSKTGNTLGSIIVAGPQSRLDLANSVVFYSSTSDNAVVWTFVPITSTTTGTLMRVSGVGILSVPSNFISTNMLQTGSDVLDMIIRMSSDWNRAINNKLVENNLAFPAGTNTKVVPICLPETGVVIGAAQIVGTSNAVANARCVVTYSEDNLMRFNVSSETCRAFAEKPATLNNAVISSLIMFPNQPGTMTTPGVHATTPERTMEEETYPET